MRVAVLGPGGVGGLVAAALARTGSDVTVVARPPTAARIAEAGIAVRSARLGDFTATPGATDRLAESVDVLFVATKATALDAALERVEARPALTVPLLNGLEHVARLRAALGPAVAAASIRVESERTAPGEIVQTSPFLRVELAADDPALRARLPAVAELLEGAGIPARVGESEAQVLWSKLARLCALACTTAGFGVPLGEIRSDPERRAALEGAVRETIAVARAEGAGLDAADTLAELSEAHPALTSSLARDLAAGRETELDAIAGAVLRAAARHGLECPVVADLAARIGAREGAR